MKRILYSIIVFLFFSTCHAQWGGNSVSLKDSETGDAVGVIQNSDNSATVEDEFGLVTSSLLYGRISDTATVPLRVDSSTSSLQTIDYVHHELHDGSTFRVQHNQDNIPGTVSSGELVIAFFVPDQTEKPHVLWEFVHEGNMTMTVYEGVTFNASAGTDRAIKQADRNSSNTSVLQGKATGSLVSNYVTVGEESVNNIYSGGSVISLKRDYAARNRGGGGLSRNEIILKTNTNYVFSLKNNETSTQGGQICLEWYEHAKNN